MAVTERAAAGAGRRLPFREELTPVSFLERSGQVHADRVAAVDGDRSWTYAEFRARSRRFAHALRQAGLQKGDRIAFLAVNPPPLPLAHFRIPPAGGGIVALHTRPSPGEGALLLQHS